MHILILPMYYPEKDSSPHRGYMFFEQAMQLAKSGCKVGLAFTEQRPLKNFTWKRYMGSLYSDQQSVLFIAGQPRTVFHLYVQQYRTERVAADHCLYQLSIRHHHHDLSVCRYQYRVAVCLVLLCPEGDSADAVQHTERYRSLFSAGSFADNRSPLHNVGHH